MTSNYRQEYKLTHYCTCGSGCVIRTNPAYKRRADVAMSLFLEAHHDAGCGPCDASTAARARRAAERREEEVERQWLG